MSTSSIVIITLIDIWRERVTGRERETERNREKQRETERETETDRDRQRQRQRQRQREKESIITFSGCILPQATAYDEYFT